MNPLAERRALGDRAGEAGRRRAVGGGGEGERHRGAPCGRHAVLDLREVRQRGRLRARRSSRARATLHDQLRGVPGQRQGALRRVVGGGEGEGGRPRRGASRRLEAAVVEDDVAGDPLHAGAGQVLHGRPEVLGAEHRVAAADEVDRAAHDAVAPRPLVGEEAGAEGEVGAERVEGAGGGDDLHRRGRNERALGAEGGDRRAVGTDRVKADSLAGEDRGVERAPQRPGDHVRGAGGGDRQRGGEQTGEDRFHGGRDTNARARDAPGLEAAASEF